MKMLFAAAHESVPGMGLISKRREGCKIVLLPLTDCCQFDILRRAVSARERSDSLH